MSEVIYPDMHLADTSLNYFVRNKNHAVFFSILKENRERVIILNTRHNILQLNFFTGQYASAGGHQKWEKIEHTWFGVSYEMLDTMFEKYKTNKSLTIKLAKFCMHSKSKTYWLKIKDTIRAGEIMAVMLGDNNENT